MGAQSQGATYPRDEAFPFWDWLRERRPRDREDLEEPEELDPADGVRVPLRALWDRMCCVGKETLQALEMWPFWLHLKQRPSLILFWRSEEPAGAYVDASISIASG